MLATVAYAILMMIVFILAAEVLQVQAVVDLLVVLVALIILVVTDAIGPLRALWLSGIDQVESSVTSGSRRVTPRSSKGL